MRIFLSYAREQHAIARALAARLRADGHRVFFDEQSLVAGAAYDGVIRREVRRCALFVFLVSRDSIAPGYAGTELALAQERWPNPRDRVLPVVLAEAISLPPYLDSLLPLRPRNDLAADVVNAVDAIRTRRVRRRAAALSIGLGTVALAAVAINLAHPPRLGPVPEAGIAAPDVPPEPAPPAVDAAEDRSVPPMHERYDTIPHRRRRSAGHEETRGRTAEAPRSSSGWKAYFPQTSRCEPRLTQMTNGWWLSCENCPPGVSGGKAFRCEEPDRAEAQAWQAAARWAGVYSWRCP